MKFISSKKINNNIMIDDADDATLVSFIAQLKSTGTRVDARSSVKCC